MYGKTIVIAVIYTGCPWKSGMFAAVQINVHEGDIVQIYESVKWSGK